MQTLPSMLHAAFHKPDSTTYRYVQSAVSALIFLSILSLILEAVLPENDELIALMVSLNQVILVIFAIEILLRIGTYQPSALKVFRRPNSGLFRLHFLARLKFLLTPLMLLDVLAVLAFFPELRGLRALRALRLLRTTEAFRYRNPLAIAQRSFAESGLLFSLAFGALGAATLIGGVSIYLVESRVNPQIDTLIDGIWWALVTVTTVGFGDITPVTFFGRIVAAGMMVSGMFTLAIFAGIVGSSLVSGMLSIREEQFRMGDYVNHVVVCGYDESSHLLLEVLSKAFDLSETCVVLFDVHERPVNLPPDFMWVQGDPTKESELDKVRLSHAAAVVVSGERDTSPQAADARTILITFTVRAYFKRHSKNVNQRRAPLYIVAEILDSENVNHARTAGADEVIETSRIGYSMIANAVRYHGVATVMSHVLLSGSHNVYAGIVPGLQTAPVSFGDLLVELQLSKRGGLVIGLRTSAGEEVINPPKNLMVEPDSQLLYLAKEALLEAPR